MKILKALLVLLSQQRQKYLLWGFFPFYAILSHGKQPLGTQDTNREGWRQPVVFPLSLLLFLCLRRYHNKPKIDWLEC